MQKFDITIHSLQDVLEFVDLAAQQPFPVTVGNENQAIDGKDFMGMLCLDFTRPLQVTVQCSQEEYRRFRNIAEKFNI